MRRPAIRRDDRHPVIGRDATRGGGLRAELDRRFGQPPAQAGKIAVLAVTIERRLRRGEHQREPPPSLASPSVCACAKLRQWRLADRCKAGENISSLPDGVANPLPRYLRSTVTNGTRTPRPIAATAPASDRSAPDSGRRPRRHRHARSARRGRAGPRDRTPCRCRSAPRRAAAPARAKLHPFVAD